MRNYEQRAEKGDTEVLKLINFCVEVKPRFILTCSTAWTIGVLGFDSRRGLGIFLFAIVSKTPPSLLSNGYQRLFPWE
jgi:hypothetical protein